MPDGVLGGTYTRMYMPRSFALDSVRRRQCLNGYWRIIIDPYENGYYDYRHEPHTLEGYFQNAKPHSVSCRIEYDFDKAPSLEVPGDWNSQRPELLFYEGTLWYKRDILVKPEPGRRQFLHFGAANYDAKVWVNGKLVAEHIGGFTPFTCEVTQNLRANDNFVVVKVDNQRQHSGVPTVNTDWWNYGGLTRDVYLIDVPETYIRHWQLAVDPTNPGRLRGNVQLDGEHLQQDIEILLPAAGLSLSLRSDATGRASFEVDATLSLWSPESPVLYDIEIACTTDRVTDRVGFRTIRVEGDQILLNGNSLYLRGISLHEEAPLRAGRATSFEDAKILLGWAKELGCNFVRLAHYPHNEWMVRAADELGLLLWCEIPVYWTIDWTNRHTLGLALQQLTEMIERDWNRAAVIVWSVGNETPLSDERLAFMRELVAAARDLDGTRLVSAALERHYADPNTQVIDDPLGADLDVIGCNEYIGWYDGLPEKADTIRWVVAYDKPIIVSEFGADARHGLHGDRSERWTEEYQAFVYERQLEMLERLPHCRGLTPWILKDFRSPRRPLPGVLDYYNRKGLVSELGARKLAFGVLSNHYRKVSEPSHVR